MNWSDFNARAPEIARPGAERFQSARLALIGTLRADGWPRISPVEPLFVSGEIVLGMIWKSKKALDLLRDPRCVLHSVVSDPDANEGEFKLQGRAVPVAEGHTVDFVRERWRMAAAAPLYVFCMDILSASWTSYKLDQGLMVVKQWNEERGVAESSRLYP